MKRSNILQIPEQGGSKKMLTTIIGILQTATMAVCCLLAKKYVFLEPDVDAGMRRRFYGIGFLIIAGLFLALGKDEASTAVLFLVGISICLGRKKYRLPGLLLMIPIWAITNGLMTPIMLVIPYLLSLSEEEALISQLASYGVLSILLVLFLVKGRAWRTSFNESMKHRSLRGSEMLMLCMATLFSNSPYIMIRVTEKMQTVGGPDGGKIKALVAIGSMVAFFMTIMMIVLIMQGNRRFYYFEQITKMQSGMISFMAEVVEDRDDNTGGHIRRTAHYVEGIAKELKRKGAYSEILTDAYIRDMVVAAPLHDIGKIHIPDAVLNKPGRLTDEEFDIMKTHTTAGEELLVHAKEELGESEYLTMAVEMAAYHHEWWNGKGYPNGISGEKIPLSARIMAVADVFDALTSKRVYKSAMPLEKAYAIIREESGTHFDPEVVEAFFAAEQKVKAGETEKN